MKSDSYKLLAAIPALNISHVFILQPGRRYLLGSAEMEAGMLVFSFDRALSRRQAWLEIVDDKLHVERHPKASQHLNADAAIKSLQLKPGESFTAGSTVFKFAAGADDMTEPAPDIAYTLSAREFSTRLQELGAKQFLDVVSAMPKLMQQNETPAGFLLSLCETLQTCVAGVHVSAWRVQWRDDWPEAMLLRAPHQTEGEAAPIFPSRHLLRNAFASPSDEYVVSTWNRRQQETATNASAISIGAQWAMCIPIPLSAHEHFALYMSGTNTLMGGAQREMQQVLAALGAIAKQHLLAARAKERQGQIGQFFSPALRAILFGETLEADEALKPGEFEATICFFDLRGSSRVAEDVYLKAGGTVADYFNRLENLLGEATTVIFETGGIVIDFQGDAILACWGVPPPGAPPQPTLQAGLAARRIVELIGEHEWPSGEANLRCGIGITSGRLLAGLFTAQGFGRLQLSKYTVFGPVVNQAARLEGMTKKFGVPILIDGAVAAVLARANMPVRRIAAVRPAGMSHVIQLYELILPKELCGTGVTAKGVKAYEAALSLFEKGDFEAAAAAMREVPNDQIELFLSEHITALRRQGPPPNWDGVINLLSK
jgi:adenylate cyclase